MKIPYCPVKNGNRFFEPSAAMREKGFLARPLGPDNAESQGVGLRLYEDWRRARKGQDRPPADPAATRELRMCARCFPPGSIGAAFQRLCRSRVWSDIPLSRRTKELWPAIERITGEWGHAAPDTMTMEILADWRGEMLEENGKSVAHKTMKVWRWLWKKMVAMNVASRVDPSLGIKNGAPPPRWQTFTEGEAVIIVKRMIRAKQYDLACLTAVAWDTLFSPTDARTLRGKHVAYTGRNNDRRMIFDRSIDGRAKTGKAAIGTLSRRTQRLCHEVWLHRGLDLTPEAFLFRRADGKPFTDHELSKLFRLHRGDGETRRLMDMRRSGSVEGNAGGADPGLTAAKLANSIQSANIIHKTYAPVEVEAVIAFDKKRLEGRRARRDRNG